MADDFDFGFSAVTAEEFKKTQADTEPTPTTGVSSDEFDELKKKMDSISSCLLYTSPSPRDGLLSRMPSSA